MSRHPVGGTLMYRVLKGRLLPALLLCLLLAALASPAAARASASTVGETADPLTICVVTDQHYLSPSLTDNGPALMQLLENGDGKVTQYCEPLLRAFIRQILSIRPDAVVVTGDLTFNGERQSHLDLSQAFSQLEDEGIAVYVLPGNHDLDNPSARAFSGDSMTVTETASAADFRNIYGRFGFEEALFSDPASQSFVCALPGSFWLLCLDANTPEAPGFLRQETLEWTEQVLREAQKEGVTVIGASHQNLLAHNELFVDGYRMGHASYLVSLFKQYGVSLHLSGHMHIQHIAHDETVTEIVTSAQCTAPCQSGLLTLTQEGWTYETLAPDVEGWAREALPDGGDAALLHFDETARGFFDRLTKERAMAELSQYPGLDEETVNCLSDGLRRVNAAYFSGRMDTVTDFDEILSAWQEHCGYSLYIVYLLSLGKEPFENQNQRELSWPAP